MFSELLECVNSTGGWEYEWKGLMGNTNDGLPIVGPVSLSSSTDNVLQRTATANIFGNTNDMRRIYACVGFGGMACRDHFGLANSLIQSIEGLKSTWIEST